MPGAPRRPQAAAVAVIVLVAGLAALTVTAPHAAQAAGTFRAGATANSGGSATSLAVSVPSGTQAKDLLLAQVVVTGGSSVTFTPPSGWTLVDRVDSTNTLIVNMAQAIYRRVATASEPASYTWSFTSGSAAAAMVAYAGIDNDIPVDAVASQASTGLNGLSDPTAPSVTTRFDSETVVHFVAKNAGVTFSAAGGTTERTDSGSPAPGTQISDETAASAGATTARSPNASGGLLVSVVGHTVALRTSTSGIKLRDVTLPGTGAPSTSVALTPPGSTMQYDVMVAQVVANNGAAITAPGTWTLADSRATGSATGDVRMSIYWKVAGASEASSYTWTSTATVSATILVYAGVDTANPVDAVASQANAASTTITAPATTTTKANDLLLGFFASDAGTSDPFTTSSGMYERVDTGQNPVVSMAAGDFAFAADEKTLGAAGAVSSFTVTSSSSQKNIGTALALRLAELQFTAATSAAWEAAGTATLTVSISSAVSLPTTASYSATGGTATGSGTDYTLAAGTVSFTAGTTTSQTFPVTIVDDAIMDGGASALDETVVVTIASPTNANVGATASHTLTIKDDEPKTSATVVDGTGAATGGAWGGWTALPAAASVTSVSYLKVTNIDPDPSGRPIVLVDFTPSGLPGVTDPTWSVTVDDNIQFACAEDATGSAQPASLTYPGFGATSATASTTFTYTATTGAAWYCKHRIVTMPSPLLDQTYSGAFTVTAT